VTIDLELDLKARPDLSVEEIDLEEFLEAKEKYAYPDWLERRVKLAALEVRGLLSRAQWPVLGAQVLDPTFVWLDRLPPTED
jgi:protein associated with RNAse G/E